MLEFVHLKPIRTGIAHPLDLSAVTAGILQYGPMDVGKRPKHIIFHEAVKSLCYSYPCNEKNGHFTLFLAVNM